MMAGISMSWIMIPGMAFKKPPAMNALMVKASPAAPKSHHFTTPHTILPTIIAMIMQR